MATKYPWGEEANHRSRYGHEPSELEDKMWQTKQTPRAYTQRRDFKPMSCDDEDNCDDDDGDTASVASNAPSTTAPSIDTLPGVVMNLIDYGYEFCCPFEFVGCESSFHPTKLDAYISHTITHFFDHRPPPKTICIFCPKIFENPEDRVENWKERMRHIADHYRRLERFENSGPDFFVIEYAAETNH